MSDLSALSLDLGSLRSGYESGAFTVADVIREVYRRIRMHQSNPIWIHLAPEVESLRAAEALGAASDAPLFGIPFAVKDNIDAAGLPTTAACPSFSYEAKEDATVVAAFRPKNVRTNRLLIRYPKRLARTGFPPCSKSAHFSKHFSDNRN